MGFDYEAASLDVNKVYLKKDKTSIIGVKNQEKVKALLNGLAMGHEA